MNSGVPYRVLVMKGSGESVLDPLQVVRRGPVGYARATSPVGAALAHAPVGARVSMMGVIYEKAAHPKPDEED